MKAEERKENETNKLRVLLERTKTKMQGRSLYILVGSLVLVAAVVLVIWFWSSSTAAANSARWIELRSAMDLDEVKKYDEFIANEKHNGKITSTIAKFMKARRIMYGEGMDRLGSPKAEDRTNALLRVEEGRKLYEEVANELKDHPVLQQEAWLSCAKAEETLLGIPKPDQSGQFRGNFGKMIEFLKKAAAINPGSEASKAYEQRVATLSGQQQEIESFYQRLGELSQTPDLDNRKFPGVPGLPPGMQFPPE